MNRSDELTSQGIDSSQKTPTNPQHLPTKAATATPPPLPPKPKAASALQKRPAAASVAPKARTSLSAEEVIIEDSATPQTPNKQPIQPQPKMPPQQSSTRLNSTQNPARSSSVSQPKSSITAQSPQSDSPSTQAPTAETSPTTSQPSSQISPRQSHFGKGKLTPSTAPSHHSAPVSLLSSASKLTMIGNRSSKTAIPKDETADQTPAPAAAFKDELTDAILIPTAASQKDHPLQRIKRRENAQAESLKQLGKKEHTVNKVLAAIRSALKHYHEESDRMNALKALIPDPNKKPDSPHLSSEHHSDDVESPQKRSSGEAHSGEGQSTNTSGISPSNDKEGAAQLAKLAPHSESTSSNDSSPEHPKKPFDTHHAPIPAAVPANVETQPLSIQPFPPAIVPLYLLFKKSEINRIVAENDLTNNTDLLVALTRILSVLRQLQGQFKGTDLFFDPLTELCQYYEQSLEQLFAAKNAEQRAQLLRETACATIFTENNAHFVEIDGALGRQILCIDNDGNEYRENKEGNRAVVMIAGNCMKPNHKGVFIKPGTENAIQSHYAMAPQDEDKPTGTSSTLIVVSGVPINDQYNAHHLGDRVEFLNGRPTVRNTIQCGKRVYGMGLLSALNALALFTRWNNAIKPEELIAHLQTLETIYRDNPNGIKNLDNWPKPLLIHSNHLGYELAPMTDRFIEGIFYVEFTQGQLNYTVKHNGIKKGSITPQELPCIAQLTEPLDWNQLPYFMKEILSVTAGRNHTKLPYTELPEHFEILRRLPHYKPETAPTEIPQTLFRLNFRNFLAAFKSNLETDPTDLKPDNMFLCWNKADNEFYLECIDGDEVFEFPVNYQSGVHRINSKNILFLFSHLLDRPLSEKEITEELEYSPLEWELFFCADIYKKNQGWNERIAEEILTDADRFVPENLRANPDEETNAPAHLVARPQRADVETKPRMLDIPLMLHHERLPMQLRTRQIIHQTLREARDRGQSLTLRQLARRVKPATALFYETQCEALVRPDDNYAESILIGYHVISSKTPAFEEVFLNVERDILPALKEHLPKNQYDGQKAQAIKDYHRIAHEKGLTSIADLCKEVRLDLLEGLSLHDILAEHHHFPDEHIQADALRSIPKAIATFVETLQGASIPTETKDILAILELLGEHFPKIDFKCRWLPDSNRPALIHEAIARAMPGALKFLLKDKPNLKKSNAEGEMPLHSLMRRHRRAEPKKVFDTLKICLESPSCDPESEDAQHRTPLMLFIDNMDSQDSDYLTHLLRVFKQKKVNVNQRTNFARKNPESLKGAGTALDYAIDSNNVTAFIALVHEEATDMVDIAAAVRFARHSKGNPTVDQAIALLTLQHPNFAYEMALLELTTETPDADHPAQCKIMGARQGVRYLLKSVWTTLFDNKGEINLSNSVKDGAHIVIPIAHPGSEKPALFAKFYPEFPDIQRLVEVICERLGCAVTCSESWRVDTAKDKAFPLLFVTAVPGEDLVDVLNDPAKRKELYDHLDYTHFALLSVIFMNIGMEDLHAKQFKVVTLPNARKRIVPFDFDRAFVSSFLQTNTDKVALIKDLLQIIMLALEHENKFFSAQAVETIMFSNGSKCPKTDLTQKQKKIHILENAQALFDAITAEGLKIDEQALTLWPRKDPLSQSCTRTGKEMDEEEAKHPFASRLGAALNQVETPQERDANKTLVGDQLKKAQSFKVRVATGLKQKMGKSQLTIIGLPLEKRTPLMNFQRWTQIALELAKSSTVRGSKLFFYARPDLYRLYHRVVSAAPKANPCSHYETVSEKTAKKKKDDQVPRTTSTQFDAYACMSRQLSTYYRDHKEIADFRTAAAFYHEQKQRLLEEAKGTQAVSEGDTTPLQKLRSEWEIEKFVKRIEWDPKNPDNVAKLKTIQELETHFSELALIGCPVLTWKSLTSILRICDTLVTLNIPNCHAQGLKGAVIDGFSLVDLFKFLAQHNPQTQTVIISGTGFSKIDVDCDDLPLLTTLVARNCPNLTSVSIRNSTLETLDLEGSENIRSLTYEYEPAEAMRRPLVEERKLKCLNIRGCKKIPGEHINAVLERAPYLTQFIHGNNERFTTRSFAWFALQQNRFRHSPDIFFAMIRDGELDLNGLHFVDSDLILFRQWLCHANAPKIKTLVIRGACYLSRLAIFEFVVKVPSITKFVYQGPYLGIRSCNFHSWDIGLKQPISKILSLSNGAIIAFTDRVPVKGLKKGDAVTYNIRMADDSAKDKRNPTQFHKENKLVWKEKAHALVEGADLKGVVEMADGTLLLSLQEDSAQPHASSYLLTLDCLTHERRALDIPDVKSFGGSLCMINHKTFVLHSDQLYIIQNTEIGWRVQHTLQGADAGHPPVTNGQDLLAYCWDEAQYRNLMIIDIQTGEMVLHKREKDKTIRILRFIDHERLAFYDGHYYAVLNVNTLEIQTLKPYRHPRFDEPTVNCYITDPNDAYVSFLPNHELIIGGGQHYEKLEFHSLQRITHAEIRKIPTSEYLITHLGDGIMLNREKGTLILDGMCYFVMDLSFRQSHQAGFSCSFNLNHPQGLEITTPSKIVPNKLNIDGNYNWEDAMFSGEFTSKTFYDFMFAFFEQYDAYRKDEGQKPFVTFNDQTIQIEGLLTEELEQLPALLAQLWQQQPSLASTHRSLSFVGSPQVPKLPLSAKPSKTTPVVTADEEATTDLQHN